VGPGDDVRGRQARAGVLLGGHSTHPLKTPRHQERRIFNT
jgi:hypothetical protein